MVPRRFATSWSLASTGLVGPDDPEYDEVRAVHNGLSTGVRA